MSTYLQRAESVLSRINELSLVSDDRDGITRIYGSPACLQAGTKVLSWMQQAGLKTRVDSIGNLRGRLECPVSNARTLVIASHIDTVINAGKFDGPLGIVMGIDLIEHLQHALPFHIELIAFCDEEGVRFHTTFLGSRVVAGSFDQAILHIKDEQGTELREVIMGTGGDPALIDSDCIAAGNGWVILRYISSRDLYCMKRISPLLLSVRLPDKKGLRSVLTVWPATPERYRWACEMMHYAALPNLSLKRNVMLVKTGIPS
jgi:hypothetical protein